MVVAVTDKGQLTVPKSVRDRLGIRPGTKIDFEIRADGSVRMRVLTRSAASLYGLLRRRGERRRSVEAMDRGIADAVAERARSVKAWVPVIALDTNVLVRLLTRDDARQAERTYRLERAAVAGALRSLADNVTLGFESRELLNQAPALYNGGSAGFAGCLIAAKAAALRCASLMTFDRRMRGLPLVEVL